ncbi:VOC family protein [Gordonia sp. ABSL1-1]|uniref:VOC family protein n=1 Tax=Gordonia sp. ABSL1-1 TaxID=3053923 RepID=UPI0025740390|nr:VOC family protein [Gordonia sp. ABSL1-1]MDL9935672.1 VOC family protein [Gordonia sp. ABSL1-1]
MSIPDPAASATPRPNALSIVVADMAAALAFYRRCGLTFDDGAESAPHAQAQVGDFAIMFDTQEVARSIDPEWTPGTGGPQMSLAFACTDPAAVDAIHADLVAAGYQSELKPFDAFWGQRYAKVRDPDNNTVDFYSALT